jgi:hypothetical protein
MRRSRQEALVPEQLDNDAVPKAKACARPLLAPKRRQQAVVAAAAKDCTELARPIPALEDHSCTVQRTRTLAGSFCIGRESCCDARSNKVVQAPCCCP